MNALLNTVSSTAVATYNGAGSVLEAVGQGAYDVAKFIVNEAPNSAKVAAIAVTTGFGAYLTYLSTIIAVLIVLANLPELMAAFGAAFVLIVLLDMLFKAIEA